MYVCDFVCYITTPSTAKIVQRVWQMNHDKHGRNDDILKTKKSVKPFPVSLPICPQQTHMKRVRNYKMKARQLTTRATAGLLVRRPSRQATEQPLLNSSVLFVLFIPCNIIWYLLLKTNNSNKVYRPIYIYTEDIRYSLLHISAVDSHLQEETPNTFLRYNGASF